MLLGKVALVSGASRGIGKAIAENLLVAGATGGHRASGRRGAEANLDGVSIALVNILPYGADLAEQSPIQSLAAFTASEAGFVDILINNAGITAPTLPLHEVSTEELGPHAGHQSPDRVVDEPNRHPGAVCRIPRSLGRDECRQWRVHGHETNVEESCPRRRLQHAG